MTRQPTRARRAPDWVLGVGPVAGWVLQDALRFGFGRHPGDGLPLLLPSLALILAGGLVAQLVARRPGRAAALVALALAASVLAGWPTDPARPAHQVWAPRALLLLTCAGWAAAGAQRVGLGPWRAGICLGLLAGALTAWRRDLWGPAMQITALTTCAALALGWLPWRRARAALTLVAVAVPVCLPWFQTPSGRPGRPDLAPATAEAPVGAPDLILIVLDTVRADHLSCYGHARETTPRLDAFARERCTRYTQARSAGNYTLPSHASLFTGLLPAEHGAHAPRVDASGHGLVRHKGSPTSRPLRADVPTLAGVLRERGYRTGAVIANCAYLHHDYGLDRGFEHYDDREPGYLSDYLTLAQLAGLGLRVGHVPYRDGDEITALALRWIEQREAARPFFLMVNYMEAHMPYLPTRSSRRAFGGPVPADPLNPPEELFELLYDRCLLDLDRHLGALLDGLEAAGVLDDAAVIVTSDHGEGFREHGHVNHGWSLYDGVVRVPLLVKPAGPRERAVDPTPVSGIEVPRLAMEALGLAPFPVRPSAFPRRELLQSEWFFARRSQALERWAASRGRDPETSLLAWIDGGRKWIAGSDGVVEAFDLASDPGEQQPLPLEPGQVEAARELARAWWAANPPLVAEDVELDEAQLERLEALGYLGD